MSYLQNTSSTGILDARHAARDAIVWGTVLTVLGIFAVLAPMFTGISITVLLGILLVAAGAVETVFVFQAPSFGKGVLRFLFGGLGVVAGFVILASPADSLGALTILLAVFFVAAGIVDIALALQQRAEDGRGWLLFGGVVSLAFGALIALQWPVSGAWAVGLYVGVRVLMHGWALMALGRAGQQLVTHLQDTRIQRLEHHVRAGARSLQETQTALADHTAMLLTLEGELRAKISSAEIDPAIRDLNQKLGTAREQMQTVSSAARESWDEAQAEADTAFENLRSGILDAGRRWQQQLGAE